jgi:hypothetical protein
MDTQEERTGLTGGHLLDPSQRHDSCTKHASCGLQNHEGSHPQRDSLAACLGGNINSLPTRASDTQAMFTPEECHQSLAANNPSYFILPITQKPSWVHPPSSYKANSSSSLVVAFEDPDGERVKALLAAQFLYALGTRATVKKWKQKAPI